MPQANLTSLDPIWTSATVSHNHALAVDDTLYSVDSRFRPRPQMAEGQTISQPLERGGWSIFHSLGQAEIY